MWFLILVMQTTDVTTETRVYPSATWEGCRALEHAIHASDDYWKELNLKEMQSRCTQDPFKGF